MAEKKEENKKTFIEERLLALKSLKDTYNLTANGIKWKKKANMKETSTKIDENDFRTQVSAIVKRQKDAEISSAIPEFTFIPLTEEAEKNRRIIKNIWKYHWMNSNVDKELNKIIGSATTFGTGIMEMGIEHSIRKVKIPKITDGILAYTEKTISGSKIFNKKVPFLNFFINGNDIENSTEAIVIEYFNKDEYVSQRENNPMFSKISEVKKTNKYYPPSSGTDGEEKAINTTDENIVTEIRYYNSAKDEYRIQANGIEILNSIIPYSHKKLPFALFIDNDAEDRIWGIGEFELLEDDEALKNEYRSLSVKATKASIGFIIKDSGNDLDVSDLEYGVQQVYETNDIEGIEHFSPNIPLQAIAQLEEKVDNDITIKSGVDFKSLLLAPEESATRTANKSLSSKKRINKCIKDNAYGFYRRFAELTMSNIQQLHEMKPIRIPVEGGSISNEGIFITDEAGSYGGAVISSDFVKGEFRVLPIVETMLGDNEQRRKDNLANFMQLAGNVLDEQQRPVIKGQQLVKLASDEYGYDFEKLVEKVSDTQSPSAIVDEVMGQAQNSPQQTDPNYIPPEQRSANSKQVPTISGQSNSLMQ